MTLSPESTDLDVHSKTAGSGTSSSARALLGGLTLSEVRLLVHDLLPRRMGVYWADFLASLALGYGAFVVFPLDRAVSVLALVCFAVSVFAIYRAALFTHEIAHMGTGEHRAFRCTWNAICGTPLLVPSFMYDMHAEHHARRTYGTALDGEYVTFASMPRLAAFGLPLAAPLAPVALVVRFLLLAPLGWLIPSLRRRVLVQASALVIDGGYRRCPPSPEQARAYLRQEAACFVYCCAVGVLVATGVVSGKRLLLAGAVVATVVLINFLRVLGAHRYEGAGEAMSFDGQVLDSVDYPESRLIGVLWAPLGLRYHATHHLLPSLPYHSLGEAHRRLSAALPPDSTYRTTSRRSLLMSVANLAGRPARLAVPPATGGSAS